MPFPEAAIQVLKQKALKGDVKATKMLMDLMKTMDMLQAGAQDGPVNLIIQFADPPQQQE
jgi:hypothetical protein